MNFQPIIMLERRQRGLDHQMRILGKNPEVYDYRNIKNMEEMVSKDYNPANLWFVEGLNENYDFLEQTKKPAVVSAYFRAGTFTYSCMGETDSDKQYVAIKTELENVDQVAEVLAKKGGETIIYGLLVNQRKTIDGALRLKTTGLEQRVRDIMALPKEAQETEIRRLLLVNGGKI